MNDVQAKSNICKIFYRLDDGTEVVFGCGCLLKCDETLKVATSWKIRNLAGGEVFAKFQDGEIKLQVDNIDKHKEHLGSEDDGKIAYISFDDTACKQNSDAGFCKEDNLEELEEMPCYVPVVDNFENQEFCEVVKEHGKVSLKSKHGSSTKILNKHDVEPKNKVVLGCPILSQKNKFLGIMDFLDVDNQSFDLVYLGIQKRDRTATKRGPIHQETDSGIQTKFSPDNPLAKLWNCNIDFRDEFSQALDTKHKEIQYWAHLADKFGIEKKIYEAFSTSDITSPTETLLEYLAVSQPTLKIKEFCKSLKDAHAFDVCSAIEDSVKAGDLSENDKVTKMCDKAPDVSDDVILKLDREGRLRRNLARARGISGDIYSTFERDNTDNPTQVFFEVLHTQNPYLNVQNFKEKVTKLGLNNVLEVLNEFKISDDMPLEDLSKHPDAKIGIENILNNLKTDFLWKLASLYQEEGMMEDVDIQKAFRKQEEVHSPTVIVMEYVISSVPGNHTIKDLIIKLLNMNRNDCVRMIAPYLKGGNDDIDKIEQGIKTFQGGASGDRRQVSSTNVEPNSVAATDQSDNPYVTVFAQ